MTTRPNPAGSTRTVIKDYKHASKIFTHNQYRLSPKYGFLYYVEFDLNPDISNLIPNNNKANFAQEMGMIVKSVSLPKFTVETKSHNAYNRVNISQHKIKYDPVSIVFHDDQADTVRSFWYDYYSYFYRDPDYNDATYSAQHKYQTRPTFEWGYSPRPLYRLGTTQSYQYIQSIRIYSLYQQQFSEYQLVNPIITRFAHGEHAAADTQSLLQHEMSIQFETVKYFTGSITENTAGGFIDLNYDRVPSPNALGKQVGQTDDIITDLANSITSVGSRTDVLPAQDKTNYGNYFSSTLNNMTNVSARTPINSGGLSIPSLGSLTQGLTTSAIVSQRIQAAGINIIGSSAQTLANGVIGGVTKGLGKNGTQIVGLAAAAIANPKAVLSTAENMAIQFAVGQATNFINQQVTKIAGQVQGEVAKFLADKVVKPFSDGFNNFAATNFSTDFQALTGTGLFSSSILTAATRESIVNAEYTKYLADALANDTDIISSTSFANGFWE